MKISVVIPAFNEQKNIEDTLKTLTRLKLPVIIVDDGSEDDTYKKARKFKALMLKHKINLGKGSALKTGCEAAFKKGAEGVVIMDADGQHNPNDLPKFLNALGEGKYDIVFGSRNYDSETPLIRFIGNKIASAVISVLFGIHLSDAICGFRAFTKKAYKKMDCESQGYGIEAEMVIKTAKNNLKYKEVSVDALYHDKSKGVTILDAFFILLDVLRWRLSL